MTFIPFLAIRYGPSGKIYKTAMNFIQMVLSGVLQRHTQFLKMTVITVAGSGAFHVRCVLQGRNLGHHVVLQ